VANDKAAVNSMSRRRAPIPSVSPRGRFGRAARLRWRDGYGFLTPPGSRIPA
jgi:hypothetical protein